MTTAPPLSARSRTIPTFVWPLLALAFILLLNLALNRTFFHFTIRDGRLFGSIIDILDRASPTILVALGMTLVIATGGVDLSVGAVMAIAGALCALLITKGHSLPYSVASALVIAMFAGMFNGLLVAMAGVQPIVATLILMVAGRGVAQLMTEGQIITVENPGFTFIANGALAALPFPITIAACAFAVCALLTRRTAQGLFIEAIGNNPIAASYAGVASNAIKLFVYTFSGLCAGVAGLIAASDIKAADANNAGLYLELDAILAVVIGGTALSGGRFSLVGSVLGALIIQTLTTTILTRGIPVELTLVVKGSVVIAICLIAFRRRAT